MNHSAVYLKLTQHCKPAIIKKYILKNEEEYLCLSNISVLKFITT